jgi:type II secretory pathway pseudopilin PulG
MRSRSSGLTLLELLLSLAILAFVVAGLASSLRLSIRGWEKTSELSLYDSEVALRIRLRLWLEAAASPGQIADFPVAFSGTGTEFSFTTLSVVSADADASATRVTVRRDNQVLSLRLAELDEDGRERAVTERTLAAGLEDVRITYFDPTGEVSGWRTTWDNPDHLPKLVRITAAPGSQPFWPEFTVRLASAE